ncbi:MAG: UDP-4-amino-4,6-dideoxy-N-acetyl-beta-L-altrosamine transaminase, partial [Candidatus Zixiibacteriota bacterium]
MGDPPKPFLPYARQHITPEDIEAVAEVLRSDWLTQGPTIARFEEALAEITGAKHVVACATGTAALHLSMLALGIGPGGTVVTSPNTFLADANCARYVGAEVAFVDIDPETGNMNPEALVPLLEADTGRRVKAIIPVHFAGQPVNLMRIREITSRHGARVVDDACHALGASYECGRGSCRIGCGEHSDMTVFSFHPVKHVATGEGGAIATNDAALDEKLRRFRNHGMVKSDFANQEMAYASDGRLNPWYYEMPEPGFNYRLTDIQAALGIGQLKRLDWSVRRRNEIAFWYHRLIELNIPSGRVKPLKTCARLVHAYHLFVVQIDFEAYGIARADVMHRLREAGIGTQVHYIPVPLQPYYRRVASTKPGQFPGA